MRDREAYYKTHTQIGRSQSVFQFGFTSSRLRLNLSTARSVTVDKVRHNLWMGVSDTYGRFDMDMLFGKVRLPHTI